MRAEARATSGPKAPRWAWWVATGFGSGYLRPAPGTWGSLAAVALWFSIFELALHGTWMGEALRLTLSFGLLAPLPIGMTLLAIRASGQVALETGDKDPSYIVADEWAGQWIALIPIALGLPLPPQPIWFDALRLVTPFALFRLFDIWKPWPAYQIQSLSGGKGIVLDDVIAGLYAAIPTFFLDRALLGWLQPTR